VQAHLLCDVAVVEQGSMEPIAARLPDGDERCWQPFVNQSPWDPMLVRRALAHRIIHPAGTMT
jgi:hypothetical protein